MALVIDIGVAKVDKYASRESGDTVEIVERPLGGVTAVLVDGQGSGAGAKALSLMLTAKAVALVKEGVRDGVVARAVQDILYAARGGRVSASVDLVSVDLRTGTLLLSRISSAPAFVSSGGVIEQVAPNERVAGTSPFVRPDVHAFPLALGSSAWVISDGIAGAGKKFGTPPVDLAAACADLDRATTGAQERADRLLAIALDCDRGRPTDDMTVIALRVGSDEEGTGIRRMHVVLPVERQTHVR